MTLAETADLLSIAAAVDKRTLGEVDVRAWQMVLDDIDFEAARDALRAHYRETTKHVMPADIVRRVKPKPSYESNVEKGIF
ncbi:hypothetical protein O3Q52_17410 [Streptomyces sp. ActVer]|uniref:hypothetical protein n=1 Tax=Streptomyces sp. ActVer TaxID=3014558 RepID=UPI0022B5B316|nr:hypothetical protein [Streptomyces sp. ActVer]MCZ4509943.1 hypothetical protein [Streptomyces sp. ActVer]